MNIVFIAGAGHSGSTLLNIILGAFPNTVSVGEIDKIIHSKTRERFMERYIVREKYPCSCGVNPGKCPFWSDFTYYMEKNKDQKYCSYYLEAIEIAKQKFEATHLIDASKNIHA